MSDIKENRTIFQICINLNDNIESLKKSRKRLLDLNPCWSYLYIRSQDQFDQIMIDNFKKSNDEFENNIYKLYSEIPNLIHGSSKTEKIHNLKEKERIRLICALVSQTDAFRLGMLYKFGGLYLDLSSKFEMDIDSEFTYYNCCLIERKQREIRSSLLYAKKNHPVIKKILNNAIHRGLIERESDQLFLAGPRCITQTIRDIPENKLVEYKTKIFDECILEKNRCWSMRGEWKKELHTPSKNKPNQKINSHWKFNY